MSTEAKPILPEDWIAILFATVTILLTTAGLSPSLPSISWSTFSQFTEAISLSYKTLPGLLLFTIVITFIALWLKGILPKAKSILGFLFIFCITIIAQVFTGNSTIKGFGLEIVLFSLLIGLLISNLFGTPNWVKPLLQTELYIKIGLVLLGCSILFDDIVKAGALGLLQSVIVVLAVWEFCFWLGKRYKLDDEMRTMLSSAVAICGVSAAIATAGAIKGDSKKLSYVISLVLITAVPMMLIMPYLAQLMHLSPAVAGAWLGGTIDTTGAVVAAGTILGEESLKYATVVKFSQNVLLGVAAFIISIYWTYTKKEATEKPSLKTIWERFPKFVLGFLIASLVFSFLLPADLVNQIKAPLKGMQTFWFALAFTCIGLETKFVDIFKMDNGRPAFVFLIAQLFNILFTLLVAKFVFG